MKKISVITLNGDQNKLDSQQCRETLAANYEVGQRIEENANFLDTLSSISLSQLDRKIKHGSDLTFEEARCGMSYVLAATNAEFYRTCLPAFSKACQVNFTPVHALAMGTAFIQLMAAKEAFNRLSPAEVAGIAAAGLMDTVVRLEFEQVIETSGMGGDKGFPQNGSAKKTINISTLTSLVLGAMGLPAIKHGSYANTSAVGSTEAIELFGAKTRFRTKEQVIKIWKKCHYGYLDAHWCKTIHDLSHLLKMETINHVVGPMTPPFSRHTRISKLMGVNEKIHPETVALAYNILHSKGQQNIDDVAIVCGLGKNSEIDPGNKEAVRRLTILDELSPFSSVVSLASGEKFLGTYLTNPHDFGISLDAEKVQVTNTQEAIHQANCETLQGKNAELIRYLAMNAALGLFISRYLHHDDAIIHCGLNRDYLRACYEQCHAVIKSGQVWDFLTNYVNTSKEYSD